ncbi:MauE/DoxX family redox-associated membrane protein [Niabella sp. 22666]|uniref:MauE/DoxX family redox-associated membrane protein n=1 Tax=Niabella sp. 22666 TaxID=3453954 RepID=UPI003F85616C
MNATPTPVQLTKSSGNVLIQIATVVLIALFLYTASDKLSDLKLFARIINESAILKGYGSLLSKVVPACELLIVLLLFIPATRKPGLLFSFVLLLIFTLYIVAMLVSGSRLPCNCGGIISSLTWTQHIVVNLLFMILSLLAFWKHRQQNLLVRHVN